MILDNSPMVWAGPRAAPGPLWELVLEVLLSPGSVRNRKKGPKGPPGALLRGKYTSKNAPKVGPEGSGGIF